MSQENVEIVRSVFAAVNRGDRETAIGFLHPEVVIDATRRPEATALRDLASMVIVNRKPIQLGT